MLLPLSLNLSLIFSDNRHIIMLVQEAHSEIGSSQSCHKGLEITAILSLIMSFIPPFSYSGNPFLFWNLLSESRLYQMSFL